MNFSEVTNTCISKKLLGNVSSFPSFLRKFKYVGHRLSAFPLRVRRAVDDITSLDVHILNFNLWHCQNYLVNRQAKGRPLVDRRKRQTLLYSVRRNSDAMDPCLAHSNIKFT